MAQGPELRVGVHQPEGSSAPRQKTIAWVSSTYFAEGLPYMVVRILSSVYFTDVGAKERYIGYLNFLGIPWNVKFLWASLLDSLSTKRTWTRRRPEAPRSRAR